VNPYRQQDRDWLWREAEIPAPAPLTVNDIEQLVSLKVTQKREEWEREKQAACADAWDQGRDVGVKDGVEARQREVQEIVRRELQWVARRLEDRFDRRKTTIRAEREFIEDEAKKLRNVVFRLDPS
jgi:hypothetical protein